jgi:hypothetical protein
LSNRPLHDLRLVSARGVVTTLESGDVVSYNIKKDAWQVLRGGQLLSWITGYGIKNDKHIHHLPKTRADASEIMEIASAFAGVILQPLHGGDMQTVRWKIT